MTTTDVIEERKEGKKGPGKQQNRRPTDKRKEDQATNGRGQTRHS